MNVRLHAPYAQIHVPLVLEEISTGTKYTVDAKVDTGSFATVISKITADKLGLEPFTQDWVELANGDPTLCDVCMCRVYLSPDREMLDIPIYVVDSENEQALLGMDILSLGNFSATHYDGADGMHWIRFSFKLLDTFVY